MDDMVFLKGCNVKGVFSLLTSKLHASLAFLGISIENNGNQSQGYTSNKNNSDSDDLSGLERSMGVVVSLRESFGFLQAVGRSKQMFFHVSEVPNDDEGEGGNVRDIHQLISVTFGNSTICAPADFVSFIFLLLKEKLTGNCIN